MISHEVAESFKAYETSLDFQVFRMAYHVAQFKLEKLLLWFQIEAMDEMHRSETCRRNLCDVAKVL